MLLVRLLNLKKFYISHHLRASYYFDWLFNTPMTLPSSDSLLILVLFSPLIKDKLDTSLTLSYNMVVCFLCCENGRERVRD